MKIDRTLRAPRSYRGVGVVWLMTFLAFVVVLIPAGFILHLSPVEWTLIILCMGLVLGMELVNSAIERLADKISTERDPVIGKIKDLSAGAVLISAIAAAIVGLIILVPKFLILIGS